jgi:putative ABC transport system permease protein
MNFFKRALKSTKAKWGRSLLLFAVFSAILVFVLAGLTIRSAAEKAASDAQKDVGATVTLSADRQAAFQKQASEDGTDSSGTRPDPGSFSMTPVSLSDAEKIAKLDNVKSYSFESSASAMASDGITAISDSSDSSDSVQVLKVTDSNAPNGGGMPGGGKMTQADFQIKGVSSTDQNSSFTAGTAKIVDGEGITADDKNTNNVVIDSTLAEANDLAVGDTFTISNSEDEDTTYKMTVKGIYESSESSSSMGMQFNFMNPANTFYTSYTFANQVNGTDGDDTVDSAVYTLIRS